MVKGYLKWHGILNTTKIYKNKNSIKLYNYLNHHNIFYKKYIKTKT